MKQHFPSGGAPMLRKRQQILHLSDEQVKEIESQFKFKETEE